MQAVVYKSTGSWYVVKTEENDFLLARIKGKFKNKQLSSTNPIAVGDTVTIEKEPAEEAWMISEIEPRVNYINRQSPHNKHKHHIIASNLQQVLLFATLVEPQTSLGFIDRFLVTAEAYHLPAIIAFNKTDRWQEKHFAQYEHIKIIYESIGYTVLKMSLENGEGVKAIEDILYNKTTLLSGHSGVGKSTFINHILPENHLKTLEVSEKTGKGQHSTTFAEMFDLPLSGKIIDTPGIRELGLVDISANELSGYFPEMRRIKKDCKYNDCEHYNEPDCSVKDAVNEGFISEERYVSYLNIKDSIAEKNY